MADANSLFYSESFSFSGGYSVYTSASDAFAGSGAVGGGGYALQPFAVYVDGTSANNIFETAWYGSTPIAPGFLGNYDASAGTVTGGTSVTFNTADSSANLSQNGFTTGGSSRFDPTGSMTVAGSGGDWLSYGLNLKEAGVVMPSSGPPYESDSSSFNVSGSFFGIFANPNNGLFYRVNLQASPGGLRARGEALNDSDVFISDTAPIRDVPEPTSMALMAISGAAVLAYRRRQTMVK